MVSIFPSFRVGLQTICLLCILTSTLGAQTPRSTAIYFGAALTETKSDRAQLETKVGSGRLVLEGASLRFSFDLPAGPYGAGNRDVFTIELKAGGYGVSIPSTATPGEAPIGSPLRGYNHGSVVFYGETGVSPATAAAFKSEIITARAFDGHQEWMGSFFDIGPENVVSSLPTEAFSPSFKNATAAVYEGAISQGSMGGANGSYRRNVTVRIVAGVDAAEPADGAVHLTVRRIESRGSPGREQVIYQTRSESWTRADVGGRSVFQAATGDTTDEGAVSELLIGRCVPETPKAIAAANVWPGKLALNSQRWIGLTGTAPLGSSRRSVESAGVLKLNRAATAKAQQAGETVDQTFSRILGELTQVR